MFAACCVSFLSVSPSGTSFFCFTFADGWLCRDLRPQLLTGSKMEKLCDKVHITLNKNAVQVWWAETPNLRASKQWIKPNPQFYVHENKSNNTPRLRTVLSKWIHTKPSKWRKIKIDRSAWLNWPSSCPVALDLSMMVCLTVIGDQDIECSRCLCRKFRILEITPCVESLIFVGLVSKNWHSQISLRLVPKGLIFCFCTFLFQILFYYGSLDLSWVDDFVWWCQHAVFLCILSYHRSRYWW